MKTTKVQLGVRITPKLAETLRSRSEELGMPKGDLVEDLLWTALALDNPDNPQLPPAFANLVERISGALAEQLEMKTKKTDLGK